jgi:Recombination endonuclease VII
MPPKGWTKPPRQCSECPNVGRIYGHGLCPRCYSRKYKREEYRRKGGVRPSEQTRTRNATRALTKWRGADPSERAYKDRANKLKRHYGLTPEQVDELAALQHRRCCICACLLEGHGVKEGGAVVDHDHVTGAIRGILCPSCNSGIGSLGDDVERLKSAIVYLRDPPGLPPGMLQVWPKKYRKRQT